MSNKLAALQKKAAALQEQIAMAELAAKNKTRTEKLTIRILNKYPDLFICDPSVLEKSLESTFEKIASSVKAK